MKANTTTFEVTVDCICMDHISAWPEIQKKIDGYNVTVGMPKGLTHVAFDVEIEAPVTHDRIQAAIDKKSKEIIGLAPYEELEDECPSESVSVKGTNVIVEMNGAGEAKEMSKFSDPDVVWRGFVADDRPAYEDYCMGKPVGQGTF